MLAYPCLSQPILATPLLTFPLNPSQAALPWAAPHIVGGLHARRCGACNDSRETGYGRVELDEGMQREGERRGFTCSVATRPSGWVDAQQMGSYMLKQAKDAGVRVVPAQVRCPIESLRFALFFFFQEVGVGWVLVCS